MRQNVAFVEYVRDRAVADMHVLVTTQSTGGGGRAWTVKFIGLGRLQGQEKTLTFNTIQTATDDERRKEFARIFRIGIVGYAADTPALSQLDVTWTRPKDAAPAATTRDPWNFWVFRMEGNTNMSGEASSQFRSYRASFSASRTTEQWKINISGNYFDNRDQFEIDEVTTVHSRRNSRAVNGLVVKSLGPQWSLGLRAELGQSSFSNIDRSVIVSPGIEYNFFPYSESSRRSVVSQYSAGPAKYDYREITIYDKVSETVPKHALAGSIGLRQPWGSLEVFSRIAQHLNDMNFYRATTFGSADVRLFKGFSFNVFAEYDKISDQIALAKGDVAPEEVLLRLRQLRTGYSYFVSLGVSYSFGSIFNSVVNPRFQTSSGIIGF